MNPHLRIVNAKTTTKPELIRLNAALAVENDGLRGLVSELQDALAREAVKHVIAKMPSPPADSWSMLNIQARSLAKKMGVLTRIRNNEIEIYMHGGWNALSTIAIPEHA